MRAEASAEACLELLELAARDLSLHQIHHMRHVGARDVLRRRVFQINPGREVKPSLTKEVLHKRRTVHRTLSRQDVRAAAQLWISQSKQSSDQFANGIAS